MSASPTQIAQAYEHANANDVIAGIKQLNQQASRYYPELGPLPKSLHTKHFELLTQRLLSMEAFRHEKRAGQSSIVFENGGEFNLSAIMAHTNFQHIEFSARDFEQYLTYTKQHSQVKPEVEIKNSDGMNEVVFPTPQEFARRDPDAILADLSYAEKIAANVYTTKFFEQMNPMMRGYFNFEKASHNDIRDVIIHTAMCASALSKAPSRELPTAFRYESLWSVEINQQRIDTANNKGITTERGFISTAEKPAGAFAAQAQMEKKTIVAIVYNKLSGKLVGPVSRYPEEREWLMPPTQMRWKGHVKTEDGTHYFFARPAIDLKAMHDSAKALPNKNDATKLQMNSLLREAANLRIQLKEECGKKTVARLDKSLTAVEQWAAKELDTMQSDETYQAKGQDVLATMWEKLSDVAYFAQVNLAQQVTTGLNQARADSQQTTTTPTSIN